MTDARDFKNISRRRLRKHYESFKCSAPWRLRSDRRGYGWSELFQGIGQCRRLPMVWWTYD